MAKVVFIILSFCYPFIIYWGLQNYDGRVLLILLALMLGIRWLFLKGRQERLLIVASLTGVILIVTVYGSKVGLKFYPVMVNLGFLLLFASSLLFPPSIVERIARVKEKDLPPEVIAYTRNVTWVWSAFFLINGSIAAYTACFSSNKIWMIYNGIIAYFLIAILIVSEWLIRGRVKRRLNG